MRHIILIVSLLFLCNISYAAKVLDKGSITPYKGVLFTMDEETKLRASKKRELKLEDLRVQHEKKIELQDKRIDYLRKHIEKSKFFNFSNQTWFVIGIVVGSFGSYHAIKAANKLK